jgi:hypothetical protein
MFSKNIRMPAPVSHVGILSAGFFTSFIHRETHFRQVFTTAWHNGTNAFMNSYFYEPMIS